MKGYRIVIGLFLLLLCGCATQSISQRADNPFDPQENLLRDGRLHVKNLEIKVIGEEIQLPLFRFRNAYHIAAPEGQRFALSLRNLSPSPKQLSLSVRLPIHEQAKLRSFGHKISLAGEETAMVFGPASASPLQRTPLTFPKTHTEQPNANVLSLSIPSQSSQSAHKIRIHLQPCTYYEQRNICPASCLCAIRISSYRTAYGWGNPLSLNPRNYRIVPTEY